MKKLTCYFLIISTLLSLLVLSSCSNDNNDKTENSDPGETTIIETKNIVLAEDGEDIYSIIRYIDASHEEVNTILEFRNTLNSKYKLSFSMGTDWSAPNNMPPEDASEIIIGITERGITSQVIEDLCLGYGDSAIQVCEHNKIVIVALNYKDLNIAFDYFMSNLSILKDTDSGKEQLIYSGGNFLFKKSDKYLWSDGGSINDYKIVYDKDGAYKKLAEKIASSIKSNCGVELELVSEITPKSDYEIIVGSLSDPNRQIIDADIISPLEYVFATSDKSICIVGNSESTLKGAVDTFINNYIKTGSVYTLNLPCNTTISFNSFTGGESPDLIEGADTRIMSFNILSEEWDSAAVLPGRDIRVPAIILNYSPDVVALQEVSNNWYPILQEMLGSKYAFTRKKNPAGSGTYTTLMYNTEKTKLIEEGIELYSVGNSQRLRSIVWGVFESIKTGERYIVFSTHWDPHADRESQRTQQAKEMAQFVKQMDLKYHVDIFACGDYNAKESSTAYKTFISESKFVDAKKAALTINRACTTYHTLFADVSTSTYESIDHITFSTETAKKVLYYNTLIADYVLDASDHCPIYVDVKLSK